VWAPLIGLIAGAGALALGSARPGPADPKNEFAGDPPDFSVSVPGGDRLVEVPIVLTDIPVLSVGPRGPVDGGFSTRARCNITSTHTDASFTGGSYFAQAGFAQTEIFAQSHVLQASDFPIRINLAETLFATSNATQATTTQWSVLFWRGTPDTGTLVASYSSDDIILPHVHLGSGTSGVNVAFSIDPNEPGEQIEISDNGSHTFTVGWRIDVHNQQTQNPCFVAPPVCCNAFPTTDVSGLAAPGGNWLFGVNCGPFGCPPNGGWKAFSGLSAGCRPTGDTVQRVAWSSVGCQPGVGPCCLPSGTCQVMTTGDCGLAGGAYQGDGASCAGINCPVPRGACCFGTGFCINNLSNDDCVGANGTWLGANTACNGSQCPTGACCLPNGACVDNITGTACTGQGGTYKGNGTVCSGQNCPQPTGACCLLNGFCLVLTANDCAGIEGSAWKGASTTCVDGDMDGRADICPCLADYDTNLFVNGDDFDAFVADFEQGLPAADVDHNSFVTGEDFDLFVDHFMAGC